jgi:hypothetical protein
LQGFLGGMINKKRSPRAALFCLPAKAGVGSSKFGLTESAGDVAAPASSYAALNTRYAWSAFAVTHWTINQIVQ